MSKAQSIARMKMLREIGHLYVAYSRYCDWIKIGFTSKPVRERLDALENQYPLFGPFSLIGSTRSYWATEQAIHAALAPIRQRKTASTAELYPAVPALVSVVKKIVACREFGRIERNERVELRDWARKAAQHPLNRIEAEICFERFRFEQAPFVDHKRAA